MKNWNVILPLTFLSVIGFQSCAIAKPPPSIPTNLEAKRDTFDPEQRIPDGVKKEYGGRLSPKATTKPFETRIDPPNWWANMAEPTVELMVHAPNAGKCDRVEINQRGITLLKTERPENTNYLFLTLDVSPDAAIGKFNIRLVSQGKNTDLPFEIKARKTITHSEKTATPSLNTADLVYLIMPDRFANGDESNDSFNDMEQRGIDRKKMFFRHGGDLKGIENNLDYIKDLGMTALWLNPVIENNQDFESYHGYAFTDHYRVDKRFGGNVAYKSLIEKCHQKGLKMVQDYVHNHFGSKHYTMRDLPEADWIHQFDTFTRTTYRDQAISDPYVSKYDQSRLLDGWFDTQMPDFNHHNLHVQRYLTQNTIWWVEEFGIDAYRLDTYLYNDQQFMSDWGKRLQKEYPNLSIFAETWVHGIINQAQTTQNNYLRKPYNSYLPAVTDFQLYFSIQDALTKQQGWTDGVTKLYQTLSNDYIYENPYRNVVFLDNHDLSRFYSIVNEDVDKMKSATAWLLTTRGIPQVYYGFELLMTGYTNPDGKVRQDFPGGWKGDSTNEFVKRATPKSENYFQYVKKMANWRKQKTCLHDGKLMQYLPVDGVYTYFRYDEKGTVMVVMNTSDKDVNIETKSYSERMSGFKRAKNVETDEILNNISTLNLKKNTALVLELMRN
ncbi:MAG: hypothetical protein RL757_2569 [Bacteroidota bacterium]|jgi:glycosidase